MRVVTCVVVLFMLSGCGMQYYFDGTIGRHGLYSAVKQCSTDGMETALAKAKSKGDKSSIREVAFLYETGPACVTNPERAYEIYKDLGDTMSCAYFEFNDQFNFPKRSKAETCQALFAWANDMRLKGKDGTFSSAEGAYVLAQCYAQGLGTPRDTYKSFEKIADIVHLPCFMNGAYTRRYSVILAYGWSQFFDLAKKSAEPERWLKSISPCSDGLRGEEVKKLFDNDQAAALFYYAMAKDDKERLNVYLTLPVQLKGAIRLRTKAYLRGEEDLCQRQLNSKREDGNTFIPALSQFIAAPTPAKRDAARKAARTPADRRAVSLAEMLFSNPDDVVKLSTKIAKHATSVRKSSSFFVPDIKEQLARFTFQTTASLRTAVDVEYDVELQYTLKVPMRCTTISRVVRSGTTDEVVTLNQTAKTVFSPSKRASTVSVSFDDVRVGIATLGLQKGQTNCSLYADPSVDVKVSKILPRTF